MKLDRKHVLLIVVALIIIGIGIWWFWPRPDPEIIVEWQGKPQFVGNSKR